MKKSIFYLPFFAMLLFMASCSHTSQMSRVQPGKLQYAQSVPQTQQDMTKADLKETPGTLAVTEENKTNAPIMKSSKPAPSKLSAALKVTEKKATKTIAKIQEKAANTKLSKKVIASAESAKLEHRLTVAIVLIVVGAVLGYFGFPLNLIGLILAVVGVVILLVWLLDAL